MSCEYCKRDLGHDKRCPNYIPEKCKHYCSICGDGIHNGEEYIMNDSYKYAHWECVDCAKDLAEFLECEIKVMENEDVE